MDKIALAKINSSQAIAPTAVFILLNHGRAKHSGSQISIFSIELLPECFASTDISGLFIRKLL